MHMITDIARQLLELPMKTDLAYLDPGSGSFILQLLIAALVGGGFLIKTYWKKITGFVARIFNRRSDGEDQ
jgi:hypothetical protein